MLKHRLWKFGVPAISEYLQNMKNEASIQACWLWQMLFLEPDGVLSEPAADFDGLLERMEAAELLVLMERVQKRLTELGVRAEAVPKDDTQINLFIDKKYTIRMDSPDGWILPLRPLVRSLFILFLRHPEGILLKQRDLYREELEEIYSVISPNTAQEDVRARVGRMVNLQDNSFSEKASVLNARLEALLPKGTADRCKIHGSNGHPRRISLPPLWIHWE